MDKILFPDQTLIKTDSFDVHQDWEVPIEGFFVIAAVRKIKSISDFNEKESAEFLPLLLKVRNAMREVLEIEEVYFYQNEDSEHGFHVWIFPRHPWMEKFGRKIQSVRPIMEYSKENMTDQENIDKVKLAAKKVQEYLAQSS